MVPSPSPLYLTACASPPSLEAAPRLISRLKVYGTVTRAATPPSSDSTAASLPGCSERQAHIDQSEAVVAYVGADDGTVSAEVFYALHKSRVPVLCLIKSNVEVPMLASNDHPLLTVVRCEDIGAAEAAIDDFLAPREPGRLVVVEGGDGAGKQTQSALLMSRLQRDGHEVRTMDFPHDKAMHGKLIRTLLSGAMGDIKQVNPLLFASLYAQNRFDVAPILKHWVRRGYIVVLDRYVEANFGHQASKLPADERPLLIAALSTFEHEWLGLPRAHRVFYLDLPPREALRALSADGSRAALDMHETAGMEYKQAVRDTFLWCASNFAHWQRVPCVADDGARVSKEKLSDVLYEATVDGLAAPSRA